MDWRGISGRPAMFVQSLVRLLSVAVPVVMIGLVCWPPLLAASQAGAEPDGTGLKAPVSQQLHGLTPGPAAKFRRLREVVPTVVEPQAEFPGLAVSQPGSGAPLTRSAFSESTGPVIVGRVLYRGLVPAPIEIQVNRDQDVCGTTQSMAALSVDRAAHGLQNAVVHVEPGAGEVYARIISETPVIVRNKECRFHPHVAVAQMGAEVQIINDDPVMHNTNIIVDNSTALNVAMVAGGSSIKKRLKKPGLHLVKCNVHKFMQAHRMVFDDPYFDQTTETGQFAITGVPPGSHRITVWHETLGVLEKDIQVPARGTVVVDLEYH
jgi:plastocyanin